MNISTALSITTLLISSAFMAACTSDKLEARLQADPQCKPMMNPKTGALMPCPGTDKEFYRSISALSAPTSKPAQELTLTAASASVAASPKANTVPVECKPQLHQKSGSLMPCPAP